MTFLEHLEEFRGRLLKSIAAWFLACLLVVPFLEKILAFLTKDIDYLVFIAPAEAFLAKMTVMLVAAFILGLPVFLYHLWTFIAEGMTRKEKGYVKIYGPLSFVFFLIGVVFAYCVIIPISLDFLLGFATPWLRPMISISKYMSFLGTLIVAFGIIFELPLVLMFLTKIGIATPAFLIHYRRHAVVFIFIMSAFLTPPDVVTQILMAGPLWALYELGIVFSKLTFKERDLSLQ